MKIKTIILSTILAASMLILPACTGLSIAGTTKFGEFINNPDGSFSFKPVPAEVIVVEEKGSN